MNEATGQKWYVVHTKPRAEQTALENLSRQGYRVYLPMMKTLKAGRRDTLEAAFEPLFPRYAFFSPSAPQQSIAPVRSTIGVSNIVRFGNTPAVIAAATLKDIQAFEARQHRAGIEELTGLASGKPVRVAGGPLAGMEGLVSAVAEDRIIVLLHLLGREVRISVTPAQLRVVV